MGDSAKVRLVRCPKCENLLPELADYSVYQCGGCGAVLRAKKDNCGVDTLSEKSDEEKAGGVSEKLENFPEKGIVNLNDASDADVKPNVVSLTRDQKGSEKGGDGYAERHRNQSKDTADKWCVENGLEMNTNKGELDSVMQREHEELNSQMGYANGYAERYRNQSKVTRGKWVDENGFERNTYRELENPMGKEHKELDSQIRYTSESWRSGNMSDWKIGERSVTNGLQRNLRNNVERVRFSSSNYPDEGPSNYHSDSTNGYRKPLRNTNDQDGSNRVEYLEQDRAELLRKLDVLKDQLSRSYNVASKPKENVPLDRMAVPPDPYGSSDAYFPDVSSGANMASMQFLGPDKRTARPSYFNHRSESFPYANQHEMAPHSYYPSMHGSNHIPGYGDPFGSQMLRRAPHQLPGLYQPPPAHLYFSGHYIDSNPDPFEPYPRHTNFHQPSCSCFHCREKHQRVSEAVPSTAFGNQRFPDVPNNPMSYHHENPVAFGPRVHNTRTAIPPFLSSRDPQTHTRWPSDVNSEMGGFFRSRPRGVVLASVDRHCHPIAGGAPFITCCNCFELLQLPKKVLLMENNKQKMQCGACSTIIKFSVIDKKLIVSVHAEARKIPTEVDDCSNEVLKESISHSHGHVNRISANFSSDDYDNSGYDFHSLDREAALQSTDQGLNSSNPQELQSFHTSSSCTSEDESSPEGNIAPRTVNNSVQQPIKATLSPPPPGSPLQEHFDYSSNNHGVNRLGKGNRSSRSDHEKVMPSKATTRQNSVKEVSLATEMEVSFNEYSNTGISQESGDASKEDDQPRNNKGSDSFFANIIKKGFRDFSRSNQTAENSRLNVSVNGNLLPDRVVKKAEKLAGPIQPGQYWYDFRAGFWGVMDGPCLGIIPPFIEEFNYPMPESCGGGNTGVFVNGRELHQKDFDLLVSRGLPTARDRSYIIEISGRVLDEDSGEELDSLGKLAPTIEKVKHGFGMKAPRAAA